MPRTHGYAPVGKRCIGRHDWNAEGRINVIGALLNNKLLNANPVDGSIDADVVYAWFRHGLLPGLPGNSVVVTDNAAFHKRGDIQQAITSCGHYGVLLRNFFSRIVYDHIIALRAISRYFHFRTVLLLMPYFSANLRSDSSGC